jgi:GH25 family lysozyme M1 (1,4-beta-N-acetylmuramidase)
MNSKIDYNDSKIKASVLFALTSFILISPAFFSFGPALAQVSKAPASNSRQIGIDVSGNDGNIDWTRVSAASIAGKPIHFAFIKATEGNTIFDSKFQNNWQGISKTKILHGAYHFFRAGLTPTDGKTQAIFFLSKLNSQKPAAYSTGFLPPVVDVEEGSWLKTPKFSTFKGPPYLPYQNKTLIVGNLKTFLDYVSLKTGRTPIIYTGTVPWKELTDGLPKALTSGFSKYLLWYKLYPEATKCKSLPGGEAVDSK